MKPWIIITATLLLSCFPLFVEGQDETQPLSPHLETVTVDPVTGFATIKWLLSPSPDVGSYVIYTFSNNTAFAVDTIHSPYSTEYTHTGSAARYMSVTYVVAAIDSSLNISPLSNSLSTIYLSSVNDTCDLKIDLLWSEYSNPKYQHDGYGIWMSVSGAPAILYETLSSTTSSFSFSDYTSGTEYCFYITAVSSGATLSSSNRQCAISAIETAPSWVYAEAVSVTSQSLFIEGSYDQATDITNFAAEVFNQVSGSWVTEASAPGMNGNIVINTSGADTTIVSLYRIAALNNCGKTVVPSSPLRNIVLVSVITATRIDLKWNNPFPSGPALYSVWRDIGTGWEEIAGSVSDTVWSEDYAAFAGQVSTQAIAYQITAVDPGAAAGVSPCRSNVAFVTAIENIFVANAFTPDDNGINDIFLPVLTFIPEKYEFRILSRTGVTLFQTTSHDTGWDGRHNDKPMPSGVYLWSLRIITPSGKTEMRSGTVTILP